MKISKIKPIFIPQLFILITIFFLFLFLPKKALATMYDTRAGCCIEPPDCTPTRLHDETKSCQSDSDPNAYCNTTTHSCWATLTFPLQKFQTELENCDKTGTMNLSCFMAGTGDVNPNGFQGMLGSLANTITLSIIGTSSANLQTSANRGAIGAISNLIAGIYANPPASSVEYIADVGRNIGLAKPVYAQGVGFNALSNLLPLWKVFRNASYVILIVVFLTMGLAIMFRIKISPQAIVSIQNAIPKLIITLILITFSYAIVGLLIDLIYLIIYVAIAIIGSDKSLIINTQETQAYFTNLNFGKVMTTIWGTSAGAASHIINPWLAAGIAGLIGALVGLITLNPIVVIGAAVGAAAGSLIIPSLILSIIALYIIFKLFFALLSSYISIILSVIFAPFQLLMGALPGSKAGFGSWFKNLLANIMVFPAVAIVMLIGTILVNATGPGWSPPVLGMSGNPLTAIIGFGIMMLLPKVPGMVKSAFGMKETGFGTAIGEAFGPVKIIPRTGGGALESAAKKAEQSGTWASGIPWRLGSELLHKLGK